MSTLCKMATWSLSLASILLFHTTTRAQPPRVSGLNELVILEPGTHSRGLPAVQFKTTPDGRRVIDIPPTVHVHRYYYSGDKKYQGPFVTGGPTVVVLNNPYNGKRMYLDVMLPSGYPQIVYRKHCITYIFPDRRVFISFPYFCREKATVTYASGKGVQQRWEDFHQKLKERADKAFNPHNLREKTKKTLTESKLVGTFRQGARATKEIAMGTYQMVDTVANTALETAYKIVSVLPGVQALQSLGKEQPRIGYEERVRQAAAQQDAKLLRYTRTLR